MSDEHELWIHQESVVISAESHDIWRFTPEFLVVSEIVGEDWICRRSTQSTDEVTIEFGPSRWVMTPTNLWITTFPNRSLKDDGADVESPPTPILANNFLVALPYLPSRRLWFFWQISASIPDRGRWIRETFLRNPWPNELGTVAVQPQMTVSLGGLSVSVTIRNETLPKSGGDQAESVGFDCYVSRPLNQTPDEMLQDMTHRTERLLLVERIIRQLLEDGS